MNIISVKDLIDELKHQKIEQKDFLTQFFNEVMVGYVTEKMKAISEEKEKFQQENIESIKEKFLERHRLDKKKNQDKMIERNPELNAMLIYYFNSHYKEDDLYTKEDKEACWDLFVEMDTRIITQPLTDGVDSAALNSFHALFGTHREISKKHGLRCQKYYEITNPIINDIVRPFASKWHPILKKEDEEKRENKTPNLEFRKELEEIQIKMNVFKSKLKEIIKIN